MKPSIAALSLILALALLAVPTHSLGQQPAKVYRIGILFGRTPPAPAYATPPKQCPIKGDPFWQAFLEGLREYGYLPGQNLLLECRYTEARAERAPALAAELVSLQPDLVVASNSDNTLALKQATRTIPILMVGIGNPVARGFVASLAHPGGNITGLTDTVTGGAEVLGKQLQLLKEAAPKASRVAYLNYPQPGSPNPAWRTAREAAARALGLTVQTYRVQTPEELEGAFTAMTKARTEAFLVEGAGFFGVHRQRLVEFAAKSRLPAMYADRYLVEAGGLMAYGPDYPAIWRLAGFYVDKILKGTKPADLPVDQPTKFELVINLKTAKALGLTLPPSLLNRADEVIQ